MHEVEHNEAIWDWIREEVTANTCFGTKANVGQHVGAFFRDLRNRTEEVKTRCRTVLQSHARALQAASATACSATTAAMHQQLGTLLPDLSNRARQVPTHGRAIRHADALALAGV